MKRPLWRRRQDADLEDELRGHLRMAVQDRLDRGQSPAEAEAAARRELGNELLVRETVRDTWGWVPLQQFGQDLVYAARALARAPAFTAAAVLTLGLGIGANAAMFSVLRAVVLRPLPFSDPARLVQLQELDWRAADPVPGAASWPNFEDWRQRTRTLESLAGYHATSVTVTGLGRALHVPGAVVSSSLFPTLGIAPSMGRGFADAEDAPGSDVAIVSDEFRRRHFGDAANPVGRALAANGRTYTIVGVMPAGFVFPVESPPPEIWLTAAEDARIESPDDTPMTTQRGARFVDVVGRMRLGVRLGDVEAEFAAITAALAREHPDFNAARGARVTPLLDSVVGDVRRPLMLLLVAVTCVLLIACVNLANLMTARGIARQAELAMRVALGASRWRLMRLLLAEAAVLAAAAAACGLVMARTSLGVLVGLAPAGVRGLDTVAIDAAVMAFAAAVAAVCALAVGVVPALRATGTDLRQPLTMSRTTSGPRSERRWLDVLVAAETAVGVVLLVASTVVVGGLARVVRTDPGFDVSTLTTFQVSLPDGRYTFAKQVAFYERLLPELAGLPGVTGATTTGPLPLAGSRYRVSFELPADTADQTASRPSAGFAFVAPGYFETMRIPLRRGRAFTSVDAIDGPRTVIVSESFARLYFPAVDPIGRRMRPGLSTTEPDTPWREIVGVAADVRQRTLQEAPEPMYYLPLAQGLITTPHVVVRTATVDLHVAEAVRQVVARIDPELAIHDVKTLDERLHTALAAPRFTTVLLAAFALLGLLLVAIGLYGVLAYRVGRRLREFGIRLALGASPRHIVIVVLAQALLVVAAGLAGGLGAALAFGRVIESALDFVQRPGAATLAVVAAIVLVTAAAAALAPVRRALRVDPMRTLRAE
ncbi:MAG: ADOP family duplicated permease [Vicinamibacterales bacterium]